MKKIMFLALSLALAATLCLTGCSKTRKAVESVGKDLCADSGKNADKVVMNESFAEFTALLIFDSMKALMPEDMTQEKFVAQMKDNVLKDQGNANEFESCSVKIEVKKCEDIYKEIAAEENVAEMKVTEKRIGEIGARMGIRNCGVISATMKKKGDEKEQTVPVYVGEINGAYQIFFAREPK